MLYGNAIGINNASGTSSGSFGYKSSGMNEYQMPYRHSGDSFAKKSATSTSSTTHVIPPPRYTLFSESTKARFFDDRNSLVEFLSSNESSVGMFWIDVTAPNRDDLAFCSGLLPGTGLHPLTIEDILETDSREKCELFDQYLLVVVSTIAINANGDHTEPSFVYIVIFEGGIISLHSRPISHHLSRVLRRLDSGTGLGFSITPDWILYALLDDFIDSLIPLVKALEFEVDSIDDLVLLLSQADKSDMVRRIGVARKATTELHRILIPKRELFKSISMKLGVIPSTRVAGSKDSDRENFFSSQMRDDENESMFSMLNNFLITTNPGMGHSIVPTNNMSNLSRGTAKTLLYLRDAQDHVFSLGQSLEHFMDTLNTAHSNYLAQISIELTDASNRMNESVKRLAVFTVIVLPLTLLSGVMGMNVPLPLQPGVVFSDLGPFFVLISLMVLFFVGFAYAAWRSRMF